MNPEWTSSAIVAGVELMIMYILFRIAKKSLP